MCVCVFFTSFLFSLQIDHQSWFPGVNFPKRHFTWLAFLPCARYVYYVVQQDLCYICIMMCYCHNKACVTFALCATATCIMHGACMHRLVGWCWLVIGGISVVAAPQPARLTANKIIPACRCTALHFNLTTSWDGKLNLSIERERNSALERH